MTQSAVSIKTQPKDARFPMMIFGSFVGHLLLFTLILAAPQLFPRSPGEAFGGGGEGGLHVVGVIDFNLGKQGPQAPPKPKEAEPAPSRYIDKLKQEKEPESITSLPDPKKSKEKPQATSTLNQKERKTEGPFGTGTNTRPDTGKSGSGGAAKVGVGPAGGGPGGQGGYGTGTGVPFPFPWYIDNVLTKIELNWVKPYIQEAVPRAYVCVVYFVILRTGQIRGIKVEESSSVPALDRSAESAILGSTPFPPLPNQWTEPDLAFRVTFTYDRSTN